MIFLDPITRAPTIGSMLMTLSAALVGVFLLVQRRSLVGEVLSHAAYPGVVAGSLLAAIFFPLQEGITTGLILGGALLVSLFSLGFMDYVKKRCRFSEDSILTFTLSTFLGVGVLLASFVQQSRPLAYKQINQFLYGQVATMQDVHIFVYACLTLLVVLFIALFFHPLRLLHFDKTFAQSVGIQTVLISRIFSLLVALSVVIGIRTVGVVLMSGMLLAPAIAARAITNRLFFALVLSGLIGMGSGFLGNWLSMQITRVHLPIGPMILLVAGTLALIALLFSKEQGVIARLFRMCAFRKKRLEENMLKIFWKNEGSATFADLKSSLPITKMRLLLALFLLMRAGYLEKDHAYCLTKEGRQRANRVVRLHRLWELYLFDQHAVSEHRVHKSASEMEHIITPEQEKRLESLLGHPEKDPHNKPIPQGEN